MTEEQIRRLLLVLTIASFFGLSIANNLFETILMLNLVIITCTGYIFYEKG